MHSHGLEELFVQELEEMYDAEKQIYKGLGLLAGATRQAELKAAFENHRKETRSQIGRLEKIFAMLGEKPRRGRASGVEGLIRQTREMAKLHDFDAAVVNAGLLSSARKIEHYESISYGCLRTHAGLLGYREIEDLIGLSLHEEEHADEVLAGIAESAINRQAAAAPYADARTGPRHDGHGPLHDMLPGEDTSGKVGLGTVVLGLAVGGLLTYLFKPSRPAF